MKYYREKVKVADKDIKSAELIETNEHGICLYLTSSSATVALCENDILMLARKIKEAKS